MLLACEICSELVLNTLLAKTKSVFEHCFPKQNSLQGEYVHLCRLGLEFRQMPGTSKAYSCATASTNIALFLAPGYPDLPPLA